MGVLSRQKNAGQSSQKWFEYLREEEGYFDSACQTLRPQPVIDTLNEYYHEYNACGGRVKYAWGKRVDETIAETRQKILKMLGKSKKDYVCAFTLNTTYGINLILSQLPADDYKSVVTSDIEHNSVFLPTIALAKKYDLDRYVLNRNTDGSIEYDSEHIERAIAVVNSASNIDGRTLTNAREFCEDVHKNSGIVVIDGAQTMGHDSSVIADVDFDALCFSSHKMYGPSLGVIVARKSLIEKLNIHFVGGGMVEDVLEDSYTLTHDDFASRFEPGLQDFGGIIAFSAALDWRKEWRSLNKLSADEYERELSTQLFEGVSSIDGLEIINSHPSSVVSFYSRKVDAHRIATILSQNNFMARSGYFCCHYYLLHKQKMPPLLRLSLGLNNTPQQVSRLIETLSLMQRNA